MGLTKETIVAQEQLASLTDEQIEAITTLAQNAEDELFRQKMGEHYRRLDESIESHSGVARNGDEKTYDYLPRAIDAMKAGFEGTIKSLNDELKAARAAGTPDAALQAKIDSLNKELASAKKEFSTLKEDYDRVKVEGEKALTDYKIDNEISRALDGIEFKNGLNSELLSTAKREAINIVKSKNPTFEEVEGEQRLVFHDGESPMLNRENQLRPFTAKELLVKEFGRLDVLNVRPATGAGGDGNKPKTTANLGAETQSAALAAIEKELADKGFKKGTADYQAELNKMWVENNVSSLPK